MYSCVLKKIFSRRILLCTDDFVNARKSTVGTKRRASRQCVCKCMKKGICRYTYILNASQNKK